MTFIYCVLIKMGVLFKSLGKLVYIVLEKYGVNLSTDNKIRRKMTHIK